MSLARDTNLELVPLLDETPPSFVMSHSLERFDGGHVSGELSQPASRTRRVFHLNGISAKEEVVPSRTQTKVRRLLNYFHAGGQLRVYRLYPGVPTAWSTTNTLGYSDIVPDDVGRGNYAFYTPALTQHTFDLDGLEVA